RAVSSGASCIVFVRSVNKAGPRLVRRAVARGVLDHRDFLDFALADLDVLLAQPPSGRQHVPLEAANELVVVADRRLQPRADALQMLRRNGVPVVELPSHPPNLPRLACEAVLPPALRYGAADRDEIGWARQQDLALER